MTKEEYLKALAQRLKRLPKEDLHTAMEYFEEYFAEAGEEHEQEAMENLGSPETAADQIIQELAWKNTQEPTKNIRQGLSRVWVGILAVFAVPIAFPLAFAAVIVVLALIIAVGSVAAAVLIAGAAGTAAGIASCAACVVLIFMAPADGLVNFGLSMVCLGLFTLLFYGGWKLCIGAERGIVFILGRIVKKGGRKNGK